MKKLTNAEIKTMGELLNFAEADAKEIADIFYTQKESGNYRLDHTSLDTLEDYTREWENCWFRYPSYEELVQSEEEQGEAYRLTPEQLEEQKGKSIFQLSSGMWVQTTF